MSDVSSKLIEARVISLPNSERRATVESELLGQGLSWSYINAVDGRSLDFKNLESYDQKKRLRRNGFEMGRGEIGCFLSHRLAWQESVVLRRPILVLEDDFRFLRKPAEWLPLAESWLNECDVLRLHGIFHRKFRSLEMAGSDRLVQHYLDPSGTTAYVITPNAASVLLEKSQPFFMPVDDFLAETWLHRQRVRSILPYPVGTTGGQSEIDSQNRTKPYLSPFRIAIREIYRIRTGWAAEIYRIWSYYFTFAKK